LKIKITTISLLAIFALLIPQAVAYIRPNSPAMGYGKAIITDGSENQIALEQGDLPQTNILVDTLDDELNSDGDCSLREAVSAANNNVITDTCLSGSLPITDTITFAITGTIPLNTQLDVTAGGSLLIDGGGGITISGGGNVQIFTVTNGANLTLENLSLIDGSASVGAGIYNSGTLTVNRSTLSGNSASISGGGIENYGTLLVKNSTLSGNSANFYGGGIHNQATLSISSSTITGNNAQTGGGLYSTGTGLSLKNTIMAANSASTNAPDCYAVSASSGGFNLLSNMDGCVFTPTTGDLTSVDPQLGPLQDNNGPTHTHALLPGSLAINQGDPDGCTDHLGNPLTTDQRGYPRTSRCDIGSYEWQSAPPGPYKIYMPTISRSCSSILYFDNFSNPSSGWPILQNQYLGYEYLGGEYRILVKNRLLWAAASPGFKASEFAVVVGVRNVNGTSGSYGVIFGLSNDWSQLYSFEISPSGEYALWRKSSTSWLHLAYGQTGFIHPGSDSNQIMIERKAGQILAYINGQLLNILKEDNYTGMRAVGLAAAATNQPNVDIRFDNFTLYPASCISSYNFLNGAVGIDDLKAPDFTPMTYWESPPHGR